MRKSILIAIALLFSSNLPGQPLREDAASAVVPRTELITRYQQLESAGADFSEDPELSKNYYETIKALQYSDLLAAFIEKQMSQPDSEWARQPEKWRELGEAWLRSGACGREKAFKAFHRALELNTADAQSHAWLGLLLHREGRYDQAAEEYVKALELDPENALALIGNAVMQIRTGDVQKGSSAIDSLGVKAQPYDIETRMMLRRALFDFEQRGGWFADEKANHAAYSRLLYRAGRLTDAILSARRAVTLDASDFETWNFIAAMQLQVGNLEQAKQAYDKSLEANATQPQVEEARKQLINELTMGGQTKAP